MLVLALLLVLDSPLYERAGEEASFAGLITAAATQLQPAHRFGDSASLYQRVSHHVASLAGTYAQWMTACTASAIMSPHRARHITRLRLLPNNFWRRWRNLPRILELATAPVVPLLWLAAALEPALRGRWRRFPAGRWPSETALLMALTAWSLALAGQAWLGQ